jgi:hypothetical protein
MTDHTDRQLWAAKYDPSSVRSNGGLSLFALLGKEQLGTDAKASHESSNTNPLARGVHTTDAVGGSAVTPGASTEQLQAALSTLYDKYRRLKHEAKENRRSTRDSSAGRADNTVHAGSASGEAVRLDLQLLARRAQDAEERAADFRRELENEKRAREAGDRAVVEARIKVGYRLWCCCFVCAATMRPVLSLPAVRCS